MSDKLLTTEEVTEYLNIDLRTLYRYIKECRIPAIRVGRQWRFRKEQIESWLQRHETPPEGMTPIAPLRVLVVDDAKPVRDLIASVLAREAFEVESFENASAALGRLRESEFDLAFVEILMPGMDGLEFIEKARIIRPEMKTVVVTGHGSLDTAKRAIALGVVRYIEKPFQDGGEILEAARAALDLGPQ